MGVVLKLNCGVSCRSSYFARGSYVVAHEICYPICVDTVEDAMQAQISQSGQGGQGCRKRLATGYGSCGSEVSIKGDVGEEFVIYVIVDRYDEQ